MLPPARSLRILLVLLVTCCLSSRLLPDSAPAPDAQTRVAQLEQIYADAVDAIGVISTIDSGLFSTYREKDRAAWKRLYTEKRAQLVAGLSTLPTEDLSPSLSQADARVVGIMRNALQSTLPEDPNASSGAIGPPSGSCKNASRKDLDAAALQHALYSCFGEVGNNLSFEGKRVTRDSAIAMLGQIDDPQRRKALFLAFVPLWETINGKDEPDSPYRRRIKFAAAHDLTIHASPIDAAAKDLGLTTDEVEQWLEKILDTWRQVTPNQPVEPWDYRYVAGGGDRGADRALASTLSPESMLAMNYAYYHDLGADLKNLGILYDLEPRPGKAPITYTDYVTMGRIENGAWQPTVSRVSASFGQSGLYVLNMLVHENGHAVHYEAIHNRPAFMDIGDDFFCEAFADVTSWNVYDPAWQRKYMGREVSESAGLRSQYTMVTLEATWALFELRMLHHPEADPNLVWTEITSHSLHIIPHPEYSWWAQRVQLVDTPGFMINYGLGAVVTAELRQHIRQQIGPFNTGNPQWYPFVSSHLLQYGTERETLGLLRDFLGRPVSPDALVNDIRRLSPVPH